MSEEEVVIKTMTITVDKLEAVNVVTAILGYRATPFSYTVLPAIVLDARRLQSCIQQMHKESYKP